MEDKCEEFLVNQFAIYFTNSSTSSRIERSSKEYDKLRSSLLGIRGDIENYVYNYEHEENANKRKSIFHEMK